MSGARAFLWLCFLGAAGVLLAAAVWLFVPRGGGAPAQDTAPVERASARASSEDPPSTEAAREILDVEPASEDEPPEEGLDLPEERPTPERSGPGQALLCITVVALETRAPVPGAVLRLRDEPWGQRELAHSEQSDPARGVEGDRLLTDEAGRAEYVLLAEREYTLLGQLEDVYGTTLLELTSLREGETRALTFAMRTDWNRDWYVAVFDADGGMPLGGAEVVARGYDPAAELDARPELARGRTDGAGRAVLTFPISSRYQPSCAVVRRAGYALGGGAFDDEENTPETPVEVALYRAAALDGLVLDPDGRPAAGIEVQLGASMAVGMGLLEDATWRATTDAQGACSLAELPSSVALAVELRRGEQVLARPAPVTLEPGARASARWTLVTGCRILGRVVDGEKKPIGGVDVLLAAVDARELSDLDFAAGALGTVDSYRLDKGKTATARSDDEGRFTLGDVPPGVWALTPAEGRSDLPALCVLFEIGPGEAERALELPVERELRVRGRVLDADGVEVYTRVTCRGREPRLAGVELYDYADGPFELGPLPAGEYWLGADAIEPLVAPAEPVAVRAGDENVELRLRPGGALYGELIDAASGEPVRGWSYLACAGVERGLSSSGIEYENLVPGTYDLLGFDGEGRVGVLRSVVVRAGERDDVELPLGAAARLEVRTQPPASGEWRVSAAWEGVEFDWTFRDEDWTVSVPPGEVHLRWWLVDGHKQSRLQHERVLLVTSPDDALEAEYAYR